jgi:hypothetical protein
LLEPYPYLVQIQVCNGQCQLTGVAVLVADIDRYKPVSERDKDMAQAKEGDFEVAMEKEKEWRARSGRYLK